MTAPADQPTSALDAQLTVKLTRPELARLKSLPRLTGDHGMSALVRRLLLAEEAIQNHALKNHPR